MKLKIRKHLKKLITLEIDILFPIWYQNQPKAAKMAFISAFLIGFISHLFVYTGRYFGNHDLGRHWHEIPTVQTGRWFNVFITQLSYGYVMPLIVGIFVTLFLSLSAFYVCKLFNIGKKINAILIGALLTTFPSVAFTNLFLYDSANYHFGVILAVLAVYVTIRFKFGFVLGGILLMLTLAIYQSKFNIALALCVFYLIIHAISHQFNFKDARTLMSRFSLMTVLAGILYAISLPLSILVHKVNLGGHRGFSPESVRNRLFSISGFTSELTRAYREFFGSFFGNIYLVVNSLLFSYLFFIGLSAIFLFGTIVELRIYKQPVRLLFIFGLLVTVPFASNFAGFLAVDTYGPMIYPFVLIFVFFIVLSERYINALPIMRSAMVVIVLFIVANYVIINNAFYLRAFFFNERLSSISTRIAGRIDILLPSVESNIRKYTYFGTLPNEYLHQQTPLFDEHGITYDGPLQHNSFVLLHCDSEWQRRVFNQNLRALHGIHLQSLPNGFIRDQIHEEVLSSNMPIWPAKGSVAIINDVIVINFGIADVIFEEDRQYLRVRHWISEGHAQHNYEYNWRVYQNDIYHFSTTTNTAELPFDDLTNENNYYVQVSIRNTSVNFNYPRTSISLPNEN